jgi:hypothetical protein
MGEVKANKKEEPQTEERELSRDERFEEKRQNELAEARRVHAERGSEPDAPIRVHSELPAHREG